MNPNNRVAEHNSSFLVLIQNILVKFISTQVLLLLLSVSLSLSTVLNLSLLSYFLSYSTCHRSFCSIRSLQFTLRRIVHGSRSAPPLPIRQSSISSNTMFISFQITNFVCSFVRLFETKRSTNAAVAQERFKGGCLLNINEVLWI